MVTRACARCKTSFSGDKTKCDPCRTYLSTWSKAHRKTVHGSKVEKAQQSRYARTEKGKKKSLRNLKSEKGQATQQRRLEKMRNDAKFKIMYRMQCKMSKMVTSFVDSKTVEDKTEFKSANELIVHLEATMTDGMSWNNYGFGSDKWQIGHRIAKSCYEKNNDGDFRICWSKMNLFAQWQTENFTKHCELPTNKELLKLKTIWPSSWNGVLPNSESRMKIENKASRGL